MIPLAWFCLLVSSTSVDLVDEVYRIPAGEWRYVEVSLRQQPASISAEAQAQGKAEDIRAAILTRDDLRRLSRERPYGVLASTPPGPSARLSYYVREPGEYAVVVDNRDSDAPATVRLYGARPRRLPGRRGRSKLMHEPTTSHPGQEMALIHHVVTGNGRPPIVFVHGFGCGHTDWDAQEAHLSPRHQCVAVDLRGHDATPGAAADCSIERYGADVAEIMRALALPPAILVGHSMGCRVVIEAALQAPADTAGLILVDGSQFAPEMAAVFRERFATPDGYATMVNGIFKDMFTTRSDPAVAASVIARARRLPQPIGEKMMTDLQRYDVGRLTHSLASLRVPLMALQATYSNEKRERRTMSKGQTTPYLDMLRANVPAVRIEIIANTGHFPQLDESAQVNALIDSFVTALLAG